jgi:hypothetical protein
MRMKPWNEAIRWIGSPALIVLCALLTGCASLSGLFAYPPFWDYARKAPTASGLAGTYHIRRVWAPGSNAIEKFDGRREVSVTIGSDNTATITNVPDFGLCGGKEISTLATWLVYDEGPPFEVRFIATGSKKQGNSVADVCSEGWETGMDLLGQRRPYRLWMWIGVPNEDRGIEFQLDPQ